MPKITLSRRKFHTLSDLRPHDRSRHGLLTKQMTGGRKDGEFDLEELLPLTPRDKCGNRVLGRVVDRPVSMKLLPYSPTYLPPSLPHSPPPYLLSQNIPRVLKRPVFVSPFHNDRLSSHTPSSSHRKSVEPREVCVSTDRYDFHRD